MKDNCKRSKWKIYSNRANLLSRIVFKKIASRGTFQIQISLRDILAKIQIIWPVRVSLIDTVQYPQRVLENMTQNLTLETKPQSSLTQSAPNN